MSSYSNSLHQIVFSTKHREKVLTKENRQTLFKYMWAICTNKKCTPYAINGVDDHVHIVLRIHNSISVADLVKSLKVSASMFIKERNLFPEFKGWQTGYGNFTYSSDAKENLVRYVENQELHHMKKTSLEEIKEILIEEKIEFDPKYLE